jgi:hypothetical protein
MAPPAASAHGPAHGGGECCGIGDRLVGRRDHHHGVAISLQGLHRGQSDRGRCISTHRLQHHSSRFGVHFPQLVQHQESVILIADHQRAIHSDISVCQCQQPTGRLLEQGRTTRKHEKLLRVTRPRQGPKAGA